MRFHIFCFGETAEPELDLFSRLLLRRNENVRIGYYVANASAISYGREKKSFATVNFYK